MKIHCAAILALASITADAFSTRSIQQQQQQQFSSTKLFADESSDEVEEPASGSSRFK
eukprot:CAMPEP_0113632156 /NCGR_PEP_ID=MMETSP0017_2-20120614/16711_1 /TAXON_ID=2856 /ORGANISM="Cylindrotheca closterium" /LENGTH=57 /DNA_ID=CAMNT_0000542695 /DNA_START=98 /DNA_END=268 /DNA_ORIENTATION=+ /assembly_acc=CAM_ASM_000147